MAVMVGIPGLTGLRVFHFTWWFGVVLVVVVMVVEEGGNTNDGD